MDPGCSFHAYSYGGSRDSMYFQQKPRFFKNHELTPPPLKLDFRCFGAPGPLQVDAPFVVGMLDLKGILGC